MNDAKHASWKDSLRLHTRCLKDIYKCSPGYIWSMIIHDIFFSINPYIIVYFSGQVINELIGPCRVERLCSLACATIVVEGIISLAKHLLAGWERAEWRISRSNQEYSLFTQKMLAMDFADIDQQEIHDKLTHIYQCCWSGNWGINRAIYYFDVLFSALVGIISAAIFTVSLFFLSVPENAGAYVHLNNPIFTIFFIMALSISVLISALFEITAVKVWASTNENMRFGNRCFQTYSAYCSGRENATTIRIYNQHDIIHSYINATNTYGKDSILAKKERTAIGWSSALAECFSQLFTGFTYAFVCLKAMGGAFGAGSILQYVGALSTLSFHISRFIQSLGNMRSNTPFLQTIYDFLDIPTAMQNGTIPIQGIDINFEIEFKNVSFKYPGTSNWALKNVNIKFVAGEHLGLVGENGSGKSTFIKLLCRLYDPQEGEILFNGINIREYDYNDYLKIFAIVFQDFQLFSQPLGSNISGASEYNATKVLECLKNAGFEGISKLQNGLETYLYAEFGEKGVEISGGEAQKIAIARALYKETPIIILDEPTSALDPVAESQLYSNLNSIIRGQTTIFISHRLSSCRFCDKVIVFDGSTISQVGSHEQLLSRKEGKYYELWRAQAQYYECSSNA